MAVSVQLMYELWKKFDLQDLQKELDLTATELANRQDESDASRKHLVELSREFKKNTAEDIRKVVAPLLKSFQSEIDALSKRNKEAESAFLLVYKRLIDLPDPVSVLEYALQIQKKAHRVQDLEIENKQLRETLDEYNHEFAEVKNQEVTIKQLREKLKEGEDRVEAVAEARTKEKERDLQRQFAEKERYLQETQISVAKKLGETEQKVATLTNTLENVQSELFEVKAKYDEASSAKSDEMEMVMADLDRANERATAAERETEKLKHQLDILTASLTNGDGRKLQKGPDMEQAIEMLQRSNLEAELAAKEKEISQLVDDVQKLQGSLKKLRENTTQQVNRLEEELTSKNKAFRILEEKLKMQEDYEEIKRELKILKSIEFSSSGGADEVDGDINKTKPLEMLLLEKTKSLQSENTQLKITCSDLSGTSSPSLSSHDKEFASLLGEEIAETYRQKTSSDALSKKGTSLSFSAVSPKKEIDEKIYSPESGDIPPHVPSSPLHDISVRRTPSTSDTLRVPPQSPQFFHPAFTNSHLMANFMGLGMGFSNSIPKSDVNGCQGLDTSMVAKTVRELLSIHNIGQRLFAKHVLGLSQGTVSELLSKPKSWDKLTEKGRESYRKMHTWATDERNVMALKAISPKKGTQPLLPSIQQEDAATEEKIAHILSEAQQAMQQKQKLEQVWSTEHQNAMVSNIYQDMVRTYGHMHVSQALPMSSPTSGIPLHHHSISDRDRYRRPSDSERFHERHESEVSSKEMVERIYRQELIKLAQAAENAGNIAASALYQQELARLAQNTRLRDEPEPGEVRHNRASSDRLKVKSEVSVSTSEDLVNQVNGPIDLSKRSISTPSTPTSGGSDKTLNSSAHAGSAFFHMHQKVNGHDVNDRPESLHLQLSPKPHSAFPHCSPPDNSSPLQRMQNIANSLMNRSQLGSPCNKPLKAVLPPITQEEFDSYVNINTEDLVKQVKETLSQYSISQRLFGESVLGLSQGSVSDLLARPKPWHMLTQKGREPFIRMQLFLEDAEAIPKLVASQYQIAPDKLMRSNSVSKEHANRRRRHSLEERYDSSMALPKRPRVFFSEEQKEQLRQAYNKDPYPNQSTIEVLASSLGVGVKTVINWFHNHRMRAKQQQHASSPTTPYSEYSQTSMGKDESNDDNSDNSDISSMSMDNKDNSNVLGFHSRLINSDSSQWLFPKFEPVGVIGNRGNCWSENNEGSEVDDVGIEGDVSSPHSTKGNTTNAKDSDKDYDDNDDYGELERDDENSGDCPFVKNEKEANPLSKTLVLNSPHSGVNKRKRSHPQYVSAGRHLDRTISRLGDLQKNFSQSLENNNDIDTEKENTSENIDNSRNVDIINSDMENNKVVSTVKENGNNSWKEGSHSSKIEKIQKSLAQHSGEHWEF